MATKTLFVGNLPLSVTTSQLTSFFSGFGGENARVVLGRGFGYVDVDASQLDSAIAEKHQGQLGGRMITVNEAHLNDPQTESGGMGNGYGHRSDLGRGKAHRSSRR